MKKKWVSYLAAAVLLFTSITVVQGSHTKAASNPPSVTAELETQVTVWQHEIAKQEPFQNWKSAEAEISALGPGTHGWLVNFNLNGKIVGYMVVNARPEGGFQLGEYGLGDEPLYSYKTLYHSLVQLEIIPSIRSHEQQDSRTENANFTAETVYLSPLHAVWKVQIAASGTTCYMDGKTAEQLPYTDQLPYVETDSEEVFASNISQAAFAISQSQYVPEFDAYESFPWLTKSPLEHSQQLLIKRLDHRERLVFTSEPWDSAMRYVWAVSSYHQWDKDLLYIGVEQNGLRYIPYTSLIKYGNFYKL
ncbi:hypothetical protein [Paenibacillus pinihumi]|uniref:hypothetical protein n=1 Tax=Paenibacillus pinihumi TaxID=669462 RepID=UPI0004241956|nr:hypothetical protein [Paenibacillus pinihumi]